MKFNTPLPQPLPKECIKAAKIFKSFVDSGNNGLDGVIPRQVLEHARGFAIFTIAKAGFLFSARAGSGIVIARLDDGLWSSPSAIGTGGLGVGGQAGAEVTDFLIVLNSRSAVRSFMSSGSLTLGGNMSIALGPLGRNGEALGSLNTSGKMAAMYSYSKTRGLFGGISIEGSVIIERQDANALAYRSNVSAKQLLSGSVTPPEWAQPLIKTLESCSGMPGSRGWVDDAFDSNNLASPTNRNAGYAFGEGVGSPGSTIPPSLRQKKSSGFPPAQWGRRKNSGSYFHADDVGKYGADRDSPPPYRDPSPLSDSHTNRVKQDGYATASFPTHFDSDFSPPSPDASSRTGHRPTLSMRSEPSHASPYQPDHTPSFPNSTRQSGFGTPRSRSDSATSPYHNMFRSAQSASPHPFANQKDDFFYDSVEESINDLMHEPLKPTSTSASKPFLAPKAGLQTPVHPSEGIGRAIALYDFNPVEPGDLGFKKGQIVIIMKKTNKTDDWWTGRLGDSEGIFPANFVEVI